MFPDNVAATNVFMAMGTQWNAGFGGAIGAKYESLPVIFDLYGVDDRADAFECFRVMEARALELMRK